MFQSVEEEITTDQHDSPGTFSEQSGERNNSGKDIDKVEAKRNMKRRKRM